MKQRATIIKRKTNETDITLDLNLDGTGIFNGSSGIGFLDHMLTVFAFQARFDMYLKATGDLNVDEHHTVEDIGIVLGKSIDKVLGDKRGITRYGFFILPMDEALATVALDLSGRFTFRLDCQLKRKKVGDLSTELVYDFWEAIAQNARMNLQMKVENGRNTHHMIEALFKAAGRALRIAVAYDTKNTVPSTKGIL